MNKEIVFEIMKGDIAYNRQRGCTVGRCLKLERRMKGAGFRTWFVEEEIWKMHDPLLTMRF